MKLLPLLDRTGNLKFWADPRSSWMTDLDGNAVPLIAVDGRSGGAGNIVHMDEAGTVLPGRCSFRLGNGNAPLPRGLLCIH
jgi:hypothetical protein